MRLILNVIWLVLAGWELFLAYVLAGILGCIFIITLPAGLASFRIAGYVIWPFGRTIVEKPGAGVGSALMNLVWFFIAGLWLALVHFLTALFLIATIIGIPLGVANLKLIPLASFPFGKQVVPASFAYLP